MGMNLKTDRGNSDRNIYRKCEWKLNALYLFGVFAIHKLYFVFKRVKQFLFFSQFGKYQS